MLCIGVEHIKHLVEAIPFGRLLEIFVFSNERVGAADGVEENVAVHATGSHYPAIGIGNRGAARKTSQAECGADLAGLDRVVTGECPGKNP